MEYTPFGWVNNNAVVDKNSWTSALNSFKCANLEKELTNETFVAVEKNSQLTRGKKSIQDFIKSDKNKIQVQANNVFKNIQNSQGYKLPQTGKLDSIAQTISLSRNAIDEELRQIATTRTTPAAAGGAKTKFSKRKTK